MSVRVCEFNALQGVVGLRAEVLCLSQHHLASHVPVQALLR